MKVTFSILCKALLSISLVFILSIAFQLIVPAEAKTIPKKRRVIKPVIINTQKLSVTGSFSTSGPSVKRAERRKASLTIVTSQLTVTGSGDMKSRRKMTMNENRDDIASTTNYQTSDTGSETKTITTNTQRLEVTGSGDMKSKRRMTMNENRDDIASTTNYQTSDTGSETKTITTNTQRLEVTGSGDMKSRRKMTINENRDDIASTTNYQTCDTGSETKTITTNTQRLEVTGSGSPAKLRPRVVRKAPLIINTKILSITGMTFVPVTVKTIKLSVTGTNKVRKTRKRGVK